MTNIHFANGAKYSLQPGETASWWRERHILVVTHPDVGPKLVHSDGVEEPLVPFAVNRGGGGAGSAKAARAPSWHLKVDGYDKSDVVRPLATGALEEFPDGAMPGLSGPTSEEMRADIIKQFMDSLFPKLDGGVAVESVAGSGGGWFEQVWFDSETARRSAHPLSDLLKTYPGPVWIGWDLAAPDGDKSVGGAEDRPERPPVDDGSWDYQKDGMHFRIMPGFKRPFMVKNPKPMSTREEAAAIAAERAGGDKPLRLGEYRDRPIINDFDVERLASKLCVASGLYVEDLWPDPNNKGGLLPMWRKFESLARQLLLQEWAKRDAWEKRPPSFSCRLDAKGGLVDKS